MRVYLNVLCLCVFMSQCVIVYVFDCESIFVCILACAEYMSICTFLYVFAFSHVRT
jgi:hypothetical protein